MTNSTSANPPPASAPSDAPAKPVSLLESMEDGKEYASLAGLNLTGPVDIGSDIRRALAEIVRIRNRPLICYAGNIARNGDSSTSIELADDVPFAELVDSVDSKHKAVDIMIATPGGLGQQVHNFVCRLRPRFNHVAFLVPHMAMSAGTIWALSGNEIVMDERGFLGPIDPQVQNRDGRWVPAQSLFTLLKQIQEDGAKSLKSGAQPDWAYLQLLKHIDPKEFGTALSATKYSIQLASTYLATYKFSGWKTTAERETRAKEIATQLSSHEDWKTHSHGIFRDTLWEKCRIQITPVEGTPGLQRALRRLWALFYWAFERTELQKVYLSESYTLLRLRQK